MWAEDWLNRLGPGFPILGGPSMLTVASQPGQLPALGMDKSPGPSPHLLEQGPEWGAKGTGGASLPPKRLAHLFLNKVHDVFEVQIIIVVLNSSSNVVVQEVNGLFKRRNYKGKEPHTPGVQPKVSRKPGWVENALCQCSSRPASMEPPPLPTLDARDLPAHTSSPCLQCSSDA